MLANETTFNERPNNINKMNNYIMSNNEQNLYRIVRCINTRARNDPKHKSNEKTYDLFYIQNNKRKIKMTYSNTSQLSNCIAPDLG